MKYMREFLKNEDRESFDNFWENSQKLVWIDWREYDEAIINYIEGVIQSGELSGKSKDVDNEMGFDIFIEWKELEKEFGEEKINYYFSKIDDESKMFDLDMDELFKILDKRKEIKNFFD